jgi:excisionase family DNA binding protein
MTFGDRFYSVAELADITGYHRDSIYRAIESGALIAAKPGGKWLIAGAAINAWLYAATTEPDPRLATPARPIVRRTPDVTSAERSGGPRRNGTGAQGSFRERARRSRAVRR